MSEPLWIRGSELVTDTRISAWANQRQSGDVCRVDFQVPAGFERYCRILHRIYGPDGALQPWSGYSELVGVTISEQTQWYELARGDPRLRNIGPVESSLDETSAHAFLEFSADRLDPDTRMIAGHWIGWSWLHGKNSNLPTAPLGLRDYVLFSVTLSALTSVYSADPSQFPGVLWPEDKSWYLSTDIDYNSTLVGGTDEFIQALRADEIIEALPIGPHVDLTYRELP